MSKYPLITNNKPSLAVINSTLALPGYALGSQHSGPVTCNMCKVVKEDVVELKFHKEGCSFPCGVVNCEIEHKSLISAVSHNRRFVKSKKTKQVIFIPPPLSPSPLRTVLFLLLMKCADEIGIK